MIDRFGAPIYVGWPEYQRLWILAALTLPRKERLAAFQDISDLTGRTLCAVQDRAYNLQAARLRASEPRMVMVVARSIPCPQRAPGSIRGPSLAQLMSGRAR